MSLKELMLKIQTSLIQVEKDVITDERILGSVSRLLEFYDKEPLHKLFHECEKGNYSTEEVFPFVDKVIIAYFGKYNETPDLSLIFEQFAYAQSSGNSKDPEDVTDDAPEDKNNSKYEIK